jgi:hypothetical protein
MRLLATGLLFACLIAPGSLLAQTPAGQRDCSQNTGSAPAGPAQKGPDGTEKPDQQAIERSAIVPNAGGHEQSAAPTVQQNGKDVIADADCPKPPNQPGKAPTN